MPKRTASLIEKNFPAIVLCCMVAGFLLRWVGLQTAAFNMDEAVLSAFASQTVHIGRFHLTGIRTSFGFHNPPFLIYLVTPFFWISRSPLLAMTFLAVLATAAIGLTADAARRIFGPREGIVAAAILTFSPLAIEHSRRLWGHDTIIFWTALAIYGVVRWMQDYETRERIESKGRTWFSGWLFLSMLATASAQACHLTGAFLWAYPLGAMVLLAFRLRGTGAMRHFRRRTMLCVLAGLFFLAVIYAPWVIADARGSPPFAEMRQVLELATGQNPGGENLTPVPAEQCWVGILADSWHHAQIGVMLDAFFQERPVLSVIMMLMRALSGFVMLGGTLYLLGPLRLTWLASFPAQGFRVLLLAGILPPVLVFTILPVTSVPPYQLPVLIPAVILAACFIPKIFEKFGLHTKKPTSLLWVLLVFYALAGTTYTAQTRHYVVSATPSETIHASYGQKRALVRRIIRDGEGENFTIMQEARPPEQGIDIWLSYIYYVLTGKNQSPLSTNAPVIYLMHDSGIILADKANAFLNKQQAIEHFGPLLLYRFEGHEADQWRAITRNQRPDQGFMHRVRTRTVVNSDWQVRHHKHHFQLYWGISGKRTIEASCTDPHFGIEQLADQFEMHRSTLYRQFKRQFNITPSQYLLRLRINVALDRLNSSNLSLVEIAESSGYRDPGYFGKVIQAATGYTPGQLRKRESDK
ncbi:MAG: helix-turn-helix domain-containing protein [bacterium]